MAKALRFVIVPKVAHPWFDEVNKGAQAQAEILSRELGAEIVVDYMPPSIADVAEQNAILGRCSLKIRCRTARRHAPRKPGRWADRGR